MSQFPTHPDPREDDDDTYDEDHWEDLEDDRDVHGDTTGSGLDKLMSLKHRGYFK